MDLTPYIPQLITAVATLGGVVLTLVFTGRRESRRVAQQLAFEREKLLADHRRDLFLRAAHALQRTREAFEDINDIEVEHGPDAWEAAVTRQVDELFTIETESLLIAPEIAANLRIAANIARLFRDATTDQKNERQKDWQSEYRNQTRMMMQTMRAGLGKSAPDAIDVGT